MGMHEPRRPREQLPCLGSWPSSAKKYKKVTGKEIYSDTLESTPMLEKEKFPQDYFPEWRKGSRRLEGWATSPAKDAVSGARLPPRPPLLLPLGTAPLCSASKEGPLTPLLMSRVHAPGREGRAAGDGHEASLAQISAGAGWLAGSAGPGPAPLPTRGCLVPGMDFPLRAPRQGLGRTWVTWLEVDAQRAAPVTPGARSAHSRPSSSRHLPMTPEFGVLSLHLCPRSWAHRRLPASVVQEL
ncbi:hypothetical protein J1605_003406 [Eschrichtius robustus]|uniref:RBPJ-interacting and tubulin-associated protein n=1 Tax=Eschrichtius robustus TaxID=9764 RepID=A0AB34HQN4_ESCRO|nr:hypothetical protein J1605_003406 [Eschrichtius robustus]